MTDIEDRVDSRARPSGLEQLVVIVVGVAAIWLGLYGGLMLAASGPAAVPLVAAAALAVVTWLWRPDGSWGARVVWKTMWASTALLVIWSVLDALLLEL